MTWLAVLISLITGAVVDQRQVTEQTADKARLICQRELYDWVADWNRFAVAHPDQQGLVRGECRQQ
jgi:hypothetical protein